MMMMIMEFYMARSRFFMTRSRFYAQHVPHHTDDERNEHHLTDAADPSAQGHMTKLRVFLGGDKSRTI